MALGPGALDRARTSSEQMVIRQCKTESLLVRASVGENLRSAAIIEGRSRRNFKKCHVQSVRCLKWPPKPGQEEKGGWCVSSLDTGAGRTSKVAHSDMHHEKWRSNSKKAIGSSAC